MGEQEVINRLIAIEEEARQITEEAEIKAQNIKSDVAEKSKQLESEIVARTEKKCVALESLEEEFASVKIDDINKKKTARIEALNNLYNENKDEWIEKIVSDILA